MFEPDNIDMKALKTHARLAAIEHLLQNLYYMHYRQIGATQNDLVTHHKGLMKALNESILEGLNLPSTIEKNPQQSKIIALELEAAVTKQLAAIHAMFLEMNSLKKPTVAPEQPKMTKVDFVGSFMLLQFYDGHHWQMSDETLDSYAASAGPELRELMRFWTLIYLAWLFRRCILGVHGAEFEKAMMASFYERMKLVPVKPGEFDMAAAIKYWFEHLDLAATAATEKRTIGEHEDLQLPNTYHAALRFISFDPGSPWYMRDDAPSDLYDKVIFGLSKVHDAMLPHIQNFAQKIEVS
jgi:hypothetical protein